jgi:hypothetical protein
LKQSDWQEGFRVHRSKLLSASLALPLWTDPPEPPRLEAPTMRRTLFHDDFDMIVMDADADHVALCQGEFCCELKYRVATKRSEALNGKDSNRESYTAMTRLHVSFVLLQPGQ